MLWIVFTIHAPWIIANALTDSRPSWGSLHKSSLSDQNTICVTCTHTSHGVHCLIIVVECPLISCVVAEDFLTRLLDSAVVYLLFVSYSHARTNFRAQNLDSRVTGCCNHHMRRPRWWMVLFTEIYVLDFEAHHRIDCEFNEKRYINGYADQHERCCTYSIQTYASTSTFMSTMPTIGLQNICPFEWKKKSDSCNAVVGKLYMLRHTEKDSNSIQHQHSYYK